MLSWKINACGIEFEAINTVKIKNSMNVNIYYKNVAIEFDDKNTLFSRKDMFIGLVGYDTVIFKFR